MATDSNKQVETLLRRFESAESLPTLIRELAKIGYFPTDAAFREYVTTGRDAIFSKNGISWLEQRNYTIRNAELDDMPDLLRLEELSWIEPLRATPAEITRRIETHPDTNLLLELNGQTAGIIYAQRIDATAPIFDHTFRTVYQLHTADGKIAQALAINVEPTLQQLALGDQLLEFLLQLATFDPTIEQVCGVTICKLYRPDHPLSLDEYIQARTEYGQPIDPILNFHHSHGAEIRQLVPHYRPADTQNEGNGVLVVYDLQNRLARHDKTGAIDASIDIATVVETAVRTVLGGRASLYARDRALMEMGLDSLELLELRGILTQQLTVPIDATLFFRHSTPAALIQHFTTTHTQAPTTHHAPRTTNDPIAVIGLACRFPGGANSPTQFWQLLRDGVDAIAEIPANRWDADALHGEDEGQIRTRYGGFVDDVDQFDAPFFRIAPIEATTMDPQQRILLEAHWQALEHAGIDPTTLKGSDTGIYVGIFSDDYRLLQIKQPDDVSTYFGTGTSNSVAAGRIAYFLGTEGATLSVDTACSSSLVSIHLACQSLQRGESSLALASGVNLMLSPELSIAFSQANMLAPDGRCKTFDAAANGYVRSEGCGVVVLKRLCDAQADGDNILAVIRGTAINQDGASNGLTAPNGLAQEAVIRKALAAAQLQPQDIDYVEAHGTGTPLGDPIEINALEAVYAGDRAAEIVVGSVKTNIGHTESAAGVAGFIKVVLALQNEFIPPHLHFNAINPLLVDAPITIPADGRAWQRNGRIRRGAISSFGFSGTNAHVIVEEAPLAEKGFDFRKQVEAISNQYSVVSEAVTEHQTPKTAFLFTGQGSQYRNMGRDLYETHPLFKERMDRCDVVFNELFGASLLDYIYAASPSKDDELMTSHPVGQAANFAVEAALADLWKAWGVMPDFVLGHSLGDFAAAYTAGVLSLEDGVKLVTERGRLMESADGAMLSVLASEAQILPFLDGLDDVTIGVINAPDSVVISGGHANMALVAEKVQTAGFKMRKLDIPVAAHSPLLDPVLDEFEAVVRSLTLSPPTCTVISSMTGTIVSDELTDPTYWRNHLRNTVRFADAVETLYAQGCEALIEAGAQDTLLKLAQRTLQGNTPMTLPSLSLTRSGWEQMLTSAEQIGESVDWAAVKRPFAVDWQLLNLSAKNEQALQAMAQRYADFLGNNPTIDLAAACRTARLGRADLRYRLGAVGDSVESLQQALKTFARGQQSPNISSGTERDDLNVAFLFTGQGAQYFEMGRDLYETLPPFRAIIEQCDRLLDINPSLHEVLFADPQQLTTDYLIDDTAYTQPALFVIEYAIATLWQTMGVAPDMLIGHSIGEIAAACFAGVFSLEDGLRLVEARGRLMSALPRDGEMVSFLADEATVAAAIAPYSDSVSIAAINGTNSVVIAGAREPVLAVAAELAELGIKTKRLTVSHAFHSPLMEPMLDDFRTVAQSITYHAPRITLISNVSGNVAGDEILSADYWVNHVRAAVRFADGINRVFDKGANVLIEVGPHPTLLGLAAVISDALMLPSLRRGENDWWQLLSSAGALMVSGMDIDVDRLISADLPRIQLPTYPFQHKRYWLDAPQPQNVHALRPLIDQKMRLPRLKQTVFEKQFSVTALPFLGEHHVYGEVIAPGASYLAMALSSAELLYNSTSLTVRDIIFPQPLALFAEQTRTVQLIAEKERDGHGFQLISFDDGDEEPLVHATGQLKSGGAAAHTVDLTAWQTTCDLALDTHQIYGTLAAQQVDLGASFRWVTGLWHDGRDRVLAQLTQPSAIRSLRGYMLYPTLIDACFQLAFALNSGETTRLPFALQTLTLYQPPSSNQQLWATARRHGNDKWDIQLVAEDGRTLAELRGFELRESSADAFQSTTLRTDWLKMRGWQTAPKLVAALPAAHYQIVGNHSSLAQSLATQLDAPLVRADALQPLNDAAIIFVAHDEKPLQLNGDLLTIVQKMVDTTARLWIVTHNGQFVAAHPTTTNPEHGSLWGFAAALEKEHPQLRVTCIDIAAEDAPLAAEIRANGDARQIALRGQSRYVAALRAWEPPTLLDRPMRLQLSEYGSIDHLTFAPQERRAPQAGEVEIRVQAAGLNFRDVMNALGMLQDYYADVLGITDPREVGLGLECAGVVTAVGEGVDGLTVGDRVMGLIVDQGTMATHLTVSAEQLTLIPDALTDVEAATLPVTFLTAWYGLVVLAQLQAGERVLIHAASGGVGQAAVQVAHAIGADVIGTASPHKWGFLREQGVQHVFNSRTLDFADEVLRVTDGRGVDVVLNSLSGAFIDRSFAALCEGGRFVEMGKVGIWSEETVAAQRPDVAYFPFDLKETLTAQPALNGELWRPIKRHLTARTLQPLPHAVFAAHEAAEAFRYMQAAKHIGKIVLSFAQARTVTLDAAASYLITGGLGALGLQTAAQLVADRARHIVLTGRRGVTKPEQQAAIDELTAAGADVRVVSADIGDRADVQRLIASCDPPLKGIVHGAGVLDDGVVTAQSAERFATVFAPKVDGTQHLHDLSADLDFFICFSSTAALVGSAGQTNYAAANAYMDSLMAQRRQMGLAGLSINWGPWGEIGLAAHLADHMQAQGMTMIAPQQGRLILQTLLRQAVGQVGVVPTQREVMEEDAVSADDLYTQLAELTPDVRKQRMDDYLRGEIATVLRLDDPSLIDTGTRLFDFGVDSLMAIELKNRIEKGLDRTVRSTLLFDYPTLERLTPHLLGDVLALEREKEKEVEDEIKVFSDDELLAFIDAEFEEFEL